MFDIDSRRRPLPEDWDSDGLPSAKPQGFKLWRPLQRYSLHSSYKNPQRAFNFSTRIAAINCYRGGQNTGSVDKVKSGLGNFEEMVGVWVIQGELSNLKRFIYH